MERFEPKVSKKPKFWYHASCQLSHRLKLLRNGLSNVYQASQQKIENKVKKKERRKKDGG